MLEKNIFGINLKFKIEFNELVTREEGISTLNKIENEILALCKKNNANIKDGIGNLIVNA